MFATAAPHSTSKANQRYRVSEVGRLLFFDYIEHFLIAVGIASINKDGMQMA